MTSIYDDYDDMSGPEEFHDALQQAGTSHEMASTHGDYDDMPGLEQTPFAQNAQGNESAPSPSFLPSWAAGTTPPPFASIYSSAVLDQPDDLSVPLSPFLVLAQALIAAGPPPGFNGDNDDDGDNDYDEVNDDDRDDDMPSLETAIPSTAPPPPTLQATTDANMTQSVANALESLMTASQNPQNGTAVGFPPSLPLMPFSFVFSPTLTISPDGGASINDASVLPSETATSIGEFAADLQAAGVDTQLIAQITSLMASAPSGVFPPFPPTFALPRRPSFDAVAFVDTLEQVDISTIPAEGMKCPHCWLPFGTTDEDDPTFHFAPDADEPPELAARQITFHEMPFCAARPDNNPVRTPCGHLFGRSCLIETMEKVDTLCPTCRKELRPAPQVPSTTE
jgi:hypothetical protein